MTDTDPMGLTGPRPPNAVNLDPAALLTLIEEHARYTAALHFYARPETYKDPGLAGDLTYVARVALGLTQ